MNEDTQLSVSYLAALGIRTKNHPKLHYQNYFDVSNETFPLFLRKISLKFISPVPPL